MSSRTHAALWTLLLSGAGLRACDQPSASHVVPSKTAVAPAPAEVENRRRSLHASTCIPDAGKGAIRRASSRAELWRLYNHFTYCAHDLPAARAALEALMRRGDLSAMHQRAWDMRFVDNDLEGGHKMAWNAWRLGYRRYASTGDWPEVAPLSRTFAAKGADVGIDAVLTSPGGAPLYDLHCHTGYSNSDDPDYSGVMQCYLFDHTKRGGQNLLVDMDASPERWVELVPAWDNRGRYTNAELMPQHIATPDWGGTRTFRLRGMRIVTRISQVKFAGSDCYPIVSYRFSISVAPDRSARTEVAARPRQAEPSWYARC